MNDERMNSAFDGIDDMEGEQLTDGKQTTVIYHDVVQERLLNLYRALNLDDNEITKFVLLVSPIGLIMIFYLFVSSQTSALISFSAFVTSLVFLGVSFVILCEILKKDVGPRSMQEIAEVIREGSEGFFVVQYGTIFKFAGFTSIGLFVMYYMREIPAGSKLNHYFTPFMMAIITSVSFLLGAICSAIAGYAGIWVSVRANLRVAAASKRCYNDAI